MLKFTHLSKLIPATLILTTASAALSKPTLETSKYVVVSDFQPTCFMQKADGILLNLSSICRTKTEPSTPIRITETPETITIPLTNLSDEVDSPDKVREEICKRFFEPSQLSRCLQAASGMDVSVIDDYP